MHRVKRRTIIQGLSGLAVGALLDGCGGGGSGQPGTPSASIPQPQPSGPLTPVPVTISGTGVGTVGARFAGLSFLLSQGLVVMGKQVLTRFVAVSTSRVLRRTS